MIPSWYLFVKPHPTTYHSNISVGSPKKATECGLSILGNDVVSMHVGMSLLWATYWSCVVRCPEAKCMRSSSLSQTKKKFHLSTLVTVPDWQQIPRVLTSEVSQWGDCVCKWVPHNPTEASPTVWYRQTATADPPPFAVRGFRILPIILAVSREIVGII
jgi:hypothetical protein